LKISEERRDGRGKERAVDTRLKNRVRHIETKRNVAVELLDRAGYAILSLVALWASAMATEWGMQFLVLSVILGLKWIFDSSRHVIQIFMQDERG
jgi:hypothetical protein